MATHSLDLESGSSQYASIADASCPNLEISGSQTFECWVKPESSGAQQYLFGKSDATPTNSKLIFLGTTNIPVFALNGLTTNSQVSAVSGISIAVWNHIAGVYDGSTLKIYINGELSNSVSASGSATDTNSAFSIGRGGEYNGNYTDGILRNVRVWNVARTQAQIRADMNVDTPSVTTGLVSNWILNNDYVDAVSAYNLTASGSPTFATVYPDALALTENLVYTKKHKIVVQHGQVAGSADLTDVPIVLTESNFLADAFNNTLNGGADLRFSTDIDGKIRLAHEVVSWDTGADTGEIWVKANTLDYDNDTDIYVHYGNATATAIDENEAFGKHQVWGESWEGVWHLNEASGTRMDATKNSYDLTDTNTVTSAAGKIGSLAAQFTKANSEYLTIADASCPALEISGSQTWMCWIKPTGLAVSNYYAPMGKVDAGGTKPHDFLIDGYSSYITAFRLNGLTTNAQVNSTSTITQDAWQMLATVYSSAGTYLRFLFNGAQEASVTASGSAVDTNSAFSIGRGGESTTYYNGLIDNAMIYNGALSNDTITTLYNNQNSPSTFAIPQSLSNASNFFLFL